MVERQKKRIMKSRVGKGSNVKCFETKKIGVSGCAPVISKGLRAQVNKRICPKRPSAYGNCWRLRLSLKAISMGPGEGTLRTARSDSMSLT